MTEYPRLGFFDMDTDKFCAMIEEMKKKGIVDMANYEDDEWIDVDDDAGDFDMSYYNDHTYEEDEVDEYDYRDEDYDDSMDGDFDSAMRDAGFGTDEDYGYYGEDY